MFVAAASRADIVSEWGSARGKAAVRILVEL